MAVMSRDALAGFVMEEALAHLLRRNGYELLTDPAQDPVSLKKAGHGLLVRGHGTDHQADSLGQLRTPTPFSLPTRLFVEAKNRTHKVDLSDVRNAMGTLSDVNQFRDTSTPIASMRRYQYHYALFSAAGFTVPAQAYALTHHISMVDLSGPDFNSLTTLVEEAARALHRFVEYIELDILPIGDVRSSLRDRLMSVDDAETIPPASMNDLAVFHAVDQPVSLFSDYVARWSALFAASLNGSMSGEELLLGFPPAPFIVPMRPDDMQAVVDYVDLYGSEIPVDITFSRQGAKGEWLVRPRGGTVMFSLRFGIPGLLEDYLLGDVDVAESRPDQVQEAYLRTISFFLEDRLISLVYDRLPVPQSAFLAEDTPEDSTDASFLRAGRHGDEPLRVESNPVDSFIDPNAVSEPVAGWTTSAARLLLDRLSTESSHTGEIILAAVRNGGRLSRTDVYEIAGFPAGRSLKGLTRPARRITGQMMTEGQLSPAASYPLQAEYESGVKASHFVVPPEVVEVIRLATPPEA